MGRSKLESNNTTPMTQYSNDAPMSALGVTGRVFRAHRTDGLWATQRWVSSARKSDEYHKGSCIWVEMRFDDSCRNGHNTFAITANIKGNDCDSGGCMHEEIALYFPELEPLIKWHLTSSDGPMHYIANTVYHAGDRDHNGRRNGERYHVKGREEKRVTFGEFPISFEYKDAFVKFIESVENWKKVKPVEVPYVPRKGETYKFSPKVTLTGYACEWYQCPFDKVEEAEEFLAACRLFTPKVVVFQDKFTRVGEGKERELDHARSSAVWPEATDEELMVEPDVLKAKLMERHPQLMADFRSAMESAGFLWVSAA